MSRNDYNYLSKVSGMILKYSALLIGMVYVIGYLYIVGVNIAFDNGQLTSIYSFNRIYF